MPRRHTSRLIPAERVPGTLREVGHGEFDLETIGFLGDVRQRSDPVGLVVEALWLISRGSGMVPGTADPTVFGVGVSSLITGSAET